MAKENKKRLIYGGSQGEIEAMRMLPPEEAERLNPSPFWKKVPRWIQQVIGVTKIPKGSGFGYIYPPYYSIYNLVYGVLPIADLPKYRILYRSQPDLKAGVDLIVNLATAKGFTIEYEHEDARKFLEDTADEIDLGIAFQMMARDAIIFGNGFLEVIWDESEEVEDEVELGSDLANFIQRDFRTLEAEARNIKNIPETAYVAVQELKPAVDSWRQAFKKKEIYSKDGRYYFKAAKLTKGKSKKIVGLKALDPVYMRVRADPFGLIYGYIQWLQWPPAVIDTDSLVHFKNAPTSEAYQTIYGQSQFLPLIKNTDLLNLFDQDVANWIHNQAVIPLWVQAGASPDKPYSTDQIRQLVSDWGTRTAATTLFTKSDVNVTVLKGGGRDLKVDWWQKYLLDRRMLALGVPPLFMGVTSGIGRATGEVMLSDFVARVQSLQNHLSAMMVDRVFVPLIEANFGKETLEKYGEPTIVWKPIIEEDRNKRLLNIDRVAVDGIISVNEARTSIGWQPFRRPDHKDYDPQFDEPTLLRIPPQMGKLGMPEKPTKPMEDVGDKMTQQKDRQDNIKKPSQDKTSKSEEIKIRAFEISTNLFQREIEAIIDEVDTELRMGGVLVRDIKAKYEMKADKLITKWLKESSLPRPEKKKLEAQFRQDVIDIINERIKLVG